MQKITPCLWFNDNAEEAGRIDELWQKLSEGGATEQCGWLRDKYGVSWQIVPTVIEEMCRTKIPKRRKEL